jgi:CheY-like chemotaxis protein
LAELIGGTLRVESAIGQGSIFTLVIPVAFDGAMGILPSSEQSRKRVLVIDDDDTFRYILKQIVSAEPRYEILEASNGADGLRRARDERPDVIFLDLQMPNIDGFTVLQQLSVDPQTSMIPVIISTSLAVNAELKSRLPVGVRLLSKNLISRENVSMFLRDAVGAQAAL